MAAAQGRVAPSQQQIEELRTGYETLRATNAQLQADLEAERAARTTRTAEAEAATFDPFAGMNADELAMLDPQVVEATRSAARKTLAASLAKLQDPHAVVREALAQRDAASLKAYISSASAELKLTELAADPAFAAFAAADDSADMLLHSFLKAPSLESAQALLPRVRTMLKRYERSAAPTPTPITDPAARLSAHLARTPDPAASGAAPQGAKTPDEAATLRRQHAAAVRRRDFKTAAQILAQINS